MTPDPHSADLERLKSLLAKSYEADQGDDTPPLPEDLRDRLTGKYGRATSTKSSFMTKVKEVYGKIANAFAQPAYAGATVAILVALIATILINQPKQDTTFRGGMENVSSTSIFLYQLDEATESIIRESGYFEESSLRVINTPEELTKISTPAIIINGLTGEITSRADENVFTTSPYSDASELPDLIVKLLQKL